MLGEMWGWKKIIIFLVPFVLVLFAAVGWVFLIKNYM